MLSALRLVYIVLGFVQFFAVWDGAMELFDIGSVVGFIVAGFLTFVPLIGAGIGIYGAVEVWDWSFLQAFLLLGWQFVLLGLTLISGATAAIPSSRENPQFASGTAAPQRNSAVGEGGNGQPTKRMNNAHIDLATSALALGLGLTAKKDAAGKFDPTIRQACFCWGFCDALSQQAKAEYAESIAFTAMVFSELFGEKCAPLIGDVVRHQESYIEWIVEGGNALLEWQRSEKPPIPPHHDE